MLLKDNQHHKRIVKHMADTNLGATLLLVGGSALSVSDALKVDGTIVEGLTPEGDIGYVQSASVLGYILHNSIPVPFGMSADLIPGVAEDEPEDVEFTRLYSALREAAAASKDKTVLAAAQALAAHESATSVETGGNGNGPE